jgi:hypothetical protein
MSLDTYIDAWSRALTADIHLAVARAINELGPEQVLANLQAHAAAEIAVTPSKLLPQKATASTTAAGDDGVQPVKPYAGKHVARLEEIRHLLTEHPGLYGYQIRRELSIDADEWRSIAGHGPHSPLSTIAQTVGHGSLAIWYLR